MNDDSKDIKKGSQCDHVSAQKPSLTAKKKSIDASVTFSGEAREEERARDLDPSHSVEQSSVKTLHLSGFDEVKLDQLPESLLISMMAFLPLRAGLRVSRLMKRQKTQCFSRSKPARRKKEIKP